MWPLLAKGVRSGILSLQETGQIVDLIKLVENLVSTTCVSRHPSVNNGCEETKARKIWKTCIDTRLVLLDLFVPNTKLATTSLILQKVSQ